MSVNRLCVEQGDHEKDTKEPANVVKSPDSSNKKSSPSIESFFKPKELNKINNEPVNRQDIQNFFMPQRKLLSCEKTFKSQVESIQDSYNEKFGENFDSTGTVGSIGVQECQADENLTDSVHKEHDKGSSKKVKQKWTLTWKVATKSKKAKVDSCSSDFEDFVKEDKIHVKKVKRRQSKPKEKDAELYEEKSKGTKPKNNAEQEDKERIKKGLVEELTGKNKSVEDNTCDQELSNGTTLNLINEIQESKERKKKKKECLEDSMERNTNQQKEKYNRIGTNDHVFSKISKKVEKGVIIVCGAEETESVPLKTWPNKNKQVQSAFDVLMSVNKKDVVLNDVDSGSSDERCPNYKLDNDDFMVKQQNNSSHKGSSAFDILMTKKKISDDSNNSRKSPQKTKLNDFKFKLNIRHSKPLEVEDEIMYCDDVETKDEHQDLMISRTIESKKITKKNKRTINDVTEQSNKKTTSKSDLEIEFPEVQSPSEVDQSDVVNITYISEENVKCLVEEPRKLTKVKKKKSKEKKAKSLSNGPIKSQEGSNSSVQEILPSSISDSTPKNSSNLSSVITSPDSDDFEVTPRRTGLRKRTSIRDYATVSEAAVDGKMKIKNDNEPNNSYPDAKSHEDEMLIMCKTARQEKHDVKMTEPKNLASIFIKKPKTLQKKETPSTQITSAQVKDEINCKPMDEAELKAANIAFNALFATCKSTKAPVSSVLTCQQPAPWPTVSHVTQKGKDQSDEEISRSGDFKKKMLPWRPEVDQETFPVKKMRIELGEFTESLCGNKSLPEKKKAFQNGVATSCISPVIAKNLLTEIASCFPGIPIKRLYKQYKNKEDEDGNLKKEFDHSKGQKEDPTKPNKGKGNSSKLEETLKKGRRQSKRKLSIQSDDELGEKQQKKVPRTKEKDGKKSVSKCNEVGDMESVTRSRKKRCREGEDEEEVEQNSKRKSTRLQRVNKEEKNRDGSSGVEKKIESSKRKKRKTMEDENNSKQVHREVEESEDSCASLSEKRNSDKRELLWTEKYQPECSSEVMGNASSVTRLRSWLEAWKIKREKTLQKELELQKRLLEKQRNNESNEKKLAWWEEDQDSDFNLSDEDNCDSDSEEAILCNTMLVTGPKGAGKTAIIYACANELGYKVFEVNSSSKRSSKQILSKLEEATQSHLVITNPSANEPKSSAFGGLFGSLSEKPVNRAPASHFNNSNKDLQDKPVKNENNRKGVRGKNGKEKGGKVTGREKGESVTSFVFGDSNPTLSLKAASLILFEEVDVIFEDDKGFWSAVTSFMRNAKCPIIMTSNGCRVDCDGGYEQLMIRSPSINLLAGHLLVTALVNNVLVNPAELKILASWYKCDIRKCLLALQFWILSGAGAKRSWEEFIKTQEDTKQRCDDEGGSGSRSDLKGKVQNTFQDTNDLNQGTVEQSLELDDRGEESLFLSLDDWKTLAKRSSRDSRCAQKSRVGDSACQNDDSEIEPTKPRCHPLMDENTHTDSIIDASDPSDSQSIQMTDGTKKIPKPDVHYLLLEDVLGLTNCIRGYGSVELLAQVDVLSHEEKDYRFLTRCSLAYQSQRIGIDLVSNNLSTLLPSLHTNRPSNEHVKIVTLATKESADIKVSRQDGALNSMFSDKSLFDDGTLETPKKKYETNDIKIKKATELTNKDSVEDAAAMATNGDTTQSRNHKESIKEFQGQTLDIFSSLAEDISYMDANIPRIPTNASSNHTAAFGWWHARLRAGLSEDVVTESKECDWLTSDTSACIRGALEVASLESSYDRYKLLLNKKKKSEPSEQAIPEYFDTFLPYKEANSVVNITGLTEAQTSKMSTRNKLYKTVSSSLSVASHCTHRAVAMDYLPTLRTICHTERLREQANTKRRFLHYLDSNSLCLSKSSQQNLADAILKH